MTTLNLQVDAGADDGYVESTGFYDSSSYVHAGKTLWSCNDWFRWTGVSIEGTIDSALASTYGYGTQGSEDDWDMQWYAEDADNPNAPTSVADYDSKDVTTASVDESGTWPGTPSDHFNSPELKTIFQELVDTYTISGDAVQLLWKNDGATENTRWKQYSYDNNTIYGAKLDIDYTAGGVTTRRYGLTVLGVG